jgi:uncharacterized membrane protein (UPF0127 family)
MPSRSTIKKTKQNPRKKKITLTRLILIILVVILVMALIIFSVYTPGKKDREPKRNTNITKSTPAFRKDGNLSITLSQSNSVVRLDIEIADEEAERMRGLMNRMSMPEFSGMLFIFERDEPRSFWMKNTYISLDIIYIDSRKEIVSIQKYTQPQTTSSIPSEKPAMYVLEVNAGFTDKHGIQAGDKIDFARE